MPKVKICGLTREEDIEAVNECLPDYAGFVFADSRRKLDITKASVLIKRLNPKVKPVGVFVDMDISKLADIAEICGLAAVQLHGDEDNRYLEDLRRLLPAKTLIIKAVRVKNSDSLKMASSAECDILLFDSYHPSASGGTGDIFNWSLLKDFARPYILAGGLNQDNVKVALRELAPWGVDVSSGVETDGLKDGTKIKEFIMKTMLFDSSS